MYTCVICNRRLDLIAAIALVNIAILYQGFLAKSSQEKGEIMYNNGHSKDGSNL